MVSTICDILWDVGTALAPTVHWLGSIVGICTSRRTALVPRILSIDTGTNGQRCTHHTSLTEMSSSNWIQYFSLMVVGRMDPAVLALAERSQLACPFVADWFGAIVQFGSGMVRAWRDVIHEQLDRMELQSVCLFVVENAAAVFRSRWVSDDVGGGVEVWKFDSCCCFKERKQLTKVHK